MIPIPLTILHTIVFKVIARRQHSPQASSSGTEQAGVEAAGSFLMYRPGEKL
jgi:hypothetical protein